MRKVSFSLVFLLILSAGILLIANPVFAESLSDRLKGKILLQVESHGEAWYVSPVDGKRYSMGRPVDAFNLMRKLGLGISNNDLNKITLVEAQSNTFKYIKDDIQVTVDCGYEGCYENKYASCEPVIMQADSGSFGAVEYKIIGKGMTGCNITFKYTKYSDSSWVNKEMTCEFDNKISYNDAFTKVFSGVTTGEVVCTGPLYDILRPRP